MAEEPESFLKRWSRLKAEQPRPQALEPEPQAAPPEAAMPGAEPQEVRAEDLPPIEELTAESDFTPFLKAGVPEELKRLALRKLWRSDPVFANLDGLVEYGEDFGALFRNPGPVATLFRIGRGMPGPGDTEEPEPVETETPAPSSSVDQPAEAEATSPPAEDSGPAPQADAIDPPRTPKEHDPSATG